MFSRYRADVDGLRAVAIVLVVLYHCGVPGLRNGFIGVDIFFVISGFVITAGLLGEIDRTDTVAVVRFWMRRALRLMPAATVMVLAILVAAPFVMTALDYPAVVSDAWAAVTYRSNFHFAGDGAGYFDQTKSPLLHTWSLAVEEQFYLLWPVFFLAMQRLWPRSRRALALAITSLTLMSFFVLMQSGDHRSVFYSPLTRAWEFGAGALVALLPVSGRLGSRAVGTICAVGGVAAVSVSLAVTDPSRFPSELTAVPVLGTVAVIAAGATPHRLVGRILRRGTLVRLGQLSYSWYLWHWPVLVLATHRAGSISWRLRLLLGVAALIPAWLTYSLLENPIRHNTRLRSSSGRSAIAIATCAVVAAATLSVASAHSRAQLDDPLLSALHEAENDHEAFTTECASLDARVVVAACAHGSREGSRRVLVLGDSHALQWLPALDPAARDLGLQLTLSVLGACPVIDARAADETPGCERRRENIPALIDTLQPDLVILAHSLGYLGSLVEPDDDAPEVSQTHVWESALFDFATSMRQRATPLLVLLDNPRYDRDPIDCIARSRDPQACSLTRHRAAEIVSASHEAETKALRRAQHGRWMDPLPLVCDAQICPLMTDGGIVTYHDTHHLTTRFTASLSSALTEELDKSLTS